MKCAYCKNVAVGYDALDLPACPSHIGEADNYVEKYSTKGKFARTNGENIFPVLVDEED